MALQLLAERRPCGAFWGRRHPAAVALMLDSAEATVPGGIAAGPQ